LTGCRSIERITIEDASVPPLNPDITITSNRTNCIFPNGTVFASLGGDILGYTFTWYAYADPFKAIATGPSINTLDIGAYYVTVTDNATGCVSDATPFEIFDARVIPEFEVITTISSCNDNNGTAELNFLVAQFIEIDTIVWFFEGQIDYEPTIRQDVKLVTGAPGNHSVWIRDGNGCEFQADFEIGTDIVIYNGISANGDGLNDIFLIDCLDYFPNNHVKIYNRAGVLIYEMFNYDNRANFFDGISNRSGTRILTDGTYFYIIDKGDGSDLRQGYLELTR
jgi:gliding motility-associated-like protein